MASSSIDKCSVPCPVLALPAFSSCAAASWLCKAQQGLAAAPTAPPCHLLFPSRPLPEISSSPTTSSPTSYPPALVTQQPRVSAIGLPCLHFTRLPTKCNQDPVLGGSTSPNFSPPLLTTRIGSAWWEACHAAIVVTNRPSVMLRLDPCPTAVSRCIEMWSRNSLRIVQPIPLHATVTANDLKGQDPRVENPHRSIP